jgi:hypothetical protein
MKTYVGVDVSIHYIQMSGQVLALAALRPGERALRTHWIGCLVGPRTGLDEV